MNTGAEGGRHHRGVSVCRWEHRPGNIPSAWEDGKVWEGKRREGFKELLKTGETGRRRWGQSVVQDATSCPRTQCAWGRLAAAGMQGSISVVHQTQPEGLGGKARKTAG